MNRRHFLELTALAGVAAIAPAARCAPSGESIVNDVSDLNPVHVARVQRPRSTDDVRVALRAWSGRVSVGGGRFSMGGQIAAPDSLHLDMRAMNEIVSLDVAGRRVRVQAGTTWRDVLDRIDPHDLAVRVMQSYSNFTVGGSVSVNCHGRYVGKGPLANSVRAVQIVTVDGEVLELTRERDSECFAGVFGGYGGLGVITEVELDLDTNDAIERRVHDVRLGDYPAFFRETILRDPRVVLHNADLTPPSFAWPRAISWMTTDRQVTVADRLIPRGLDYSLEQNAIWVMTELPGGKLLREGIVDRINLAGKPVVWRNHEASLDTASLEPRTRSMSTYLLQEYFIPVGNFVPFARRMAAILRERGVNALNVSIRHSPPDTQSLMRWAPTEVFSFVLYYKQLHTEAASRAASAWTRLLIDAALANGGRYYLPYRRDATGAQFAKAYPEAGKFAALKARVDPGRRLTNLLWDQYLPRR